MLCYRFGVVNRSEQAKPFLPATRVNPPDVDDFFDIVSGELSQQFVESEVQLVICFFRVQRDHGVKMNAALVVDRQFMKVFINVEWWQNERARESGILCIGFCRISVGHRVT